MGAVVWECGLNAYTQEVVPNGIERDYVLTALSHAPDANQIGASVVSPPPVHAKVSLRGKASDGLSCAVSRSRCVSFPNYSSRSFRGLSGGLSDSRHKAEVRI
jgi:hypothetical protein